MTTPVDEDRVAAVMREMLSAGERARPPVTAAELRNQVSRRALRRIDTKVVVAVAAVAAVIVTLIVIGPLHSGRGPSRSPLSTVPTTTTTPTTTTPTTTTPVTVPVAAASELDSYVAAEAATDSAAAAQSGQVPFVVDHSPPTVDGSDIVALVAVSYDPGGHPVQVLGYGDGRWAPVAALASPSGQGTAPSSVVYLTQGPVSVADVTGDGRPDFLVEAGAADNVPGFVVSEVGGTWHYVAFVGPYAPGLTYIIGRNPEFQGNTLVSYYDNCTPNCAQGQNSTIVWTYQRSTGEFTAPLPAGYPDSTTTTGPS
jgi:hypothetical protein